MNFKVVILTIATFTVGLVELIIGGVLPQIAQDLNVSVSTAGQLIMIYALVYAIAGPTLLALTAKIERKRLYLWSMFIFILGSLLAFWSPNYAVLFVSRIVTAASGVADRDIVVDHCSQSGVQGLSGPCPWCHLHGG